MLSYDCFQSLQSIHCMSSLSQTIRPVTYVMVSSVSSSHLLSCSLMQVPSAAMYNTITATDLHRFFVSTINAPCIPCMSKTMQSFVAVAANAGWQKPRPKYCNCYASTYTETRIRTHLMSDFYYYSDPADVFWLEPDRSDVPRNQVARASGVRWQYMAYSDSYPRYPSS